MRAIILCAGYGSRFDDTKPKGLISVNGQTIIEKQIEQYQKLGITDITLVVGHLKEMFAVENVNYIRDEKYTEHDIVGSILSARCLLDDDVIISYSDIVFDFEDLERLAKKPFDFNILVDHDWQKRYEGRTNHPYSEADTILLNGNMAVKFAKGIINNSVEFVGVMKMRKSGCKYFLNVCDKLDSLKNVKLLDVLQILTGKFGIMTEPVKNDWYEIDTQQDLERLRN